jgi:putative transposase
LLILVRVISFVEILQLNYLDKLVEQDYHFINKITKPVMGISKFSIPPKQPSMELNDGIKTAQMS